MLYRYLVPWLHCLTYKALTFLLFNILFIPWHSHTYIKCVLITSIHDSPRHPSTCAPSTFKNLWLIESNYWCLNEHKQVTSIHILEESETAPPPPPETTIATCSSARVKPQESFLGPSMLDFCLAWPHESNHEAMSLVQKTFHVIPPHLLALILFPVPTPWCSLNLVEVVTVTYTISAFWPVMLLCIDHCPPTLAKILPLVASGRRGVNFLYECGPWWVIHLPVKAAHLRVYEQHKLKGSKTKTGQSLVGLESWNGSGRSGERGQIWSKHDVWNPQRANEIDEEGNFFD